MEKEVIIYSESRSRDIQQIYEEVEYIFTIIEEIKIEVENRDKDIETISDMILKTVTVKKETQKDLEISRESIEDYKLFTGLGLSSLIAIYNPYIGVIGIGTCLILNKIF